MALSEEQKGERYLLAGSILWSLFPVVTVVLVQMFPPITTAGIATLIAALFFAVWVSLKGEWHFLQNSVWADILLSSVIVGVVYYGLLFSGLAFTTAGTAAILNLSQVFFAFFILGVLFKFEQHTKWHYMGAVFMVAGAWVVLFPEGGLSYDWGGVLVVLAAAVAPVGNFFAKRATQVVSAAFLMFIRSMVAGAFLLALGFFIEQPGIPKGYLFWTLVSFLGIVLLGISKVFWQESIKRIAIAKANAMGAFEPLLTLLFAFIFLGDIPTATQGAGFIPIALGMYLLMKKSS